MKSIFNIIVLWLVISNSNGLWANSFEITELPFKLEGDWQLCVKKELLSPPDCTTHNVPENIEFAFPDFDGFLTYRSHFTLPKELANQPLGIYIESIRDADEIYINSVFIDSTGKLAPDFEKANLHSRHYFIPNNILKTSQKNSIEIIVYNHARFGGIVASAPVLDTAKNISNQLMRKNSFIMFYMGIFFIISIIQIFYFVAQRNHKEHLYFALFSLFTVLHLYTFSNFPVTSGASLNFNFSLSIFLFAALTILFFLFINSFFHKRISTLYKVVISILAIGALVQVTILPLDYVYHQVTLIHIITFIFLGPYYFWLFYQSIKEKIPYAKTIALVSSLHIFAAVTDMLIDMQLLSPLISGIAGLISPITLMLLFITVSLVLTHRHWLYYRHATYDFLTDALRRSAFIERLTEEIPRSQRLKEPLMVALLDIDNFKTINDNYNHSAGDKVLVELVKRTRKLLREFDLLGRYGGDEFCIAASVANTADAIKLLKRIQNNIHNEKIQINDDTAIHVSITIGAYVADPNSDFHPEVLISEADKVLVKGKINQKGKVHI